MTYQPPNNPPPNIPPPLNYNTTQGPSTSALAITALVLGIVGFCFFPAAVGAAICGGIAISKTGPGKQNGRGMAIAGTVMGGLGCLVIPLLLISILLPSLNRAREIANRVKCASNLRQIGVAVQLYANQNNGMFPPSDQVILDTQSIGPSVFNCPSSNDTPAQTLSPGHDSYVYIGSKLSNASNPDAIVAYEALTNHGGDGGNVLFVDGHVDFFQKNQLSALLSAVSAGQNPPPAGLLSNP